MGYFPNKVSLHRLDLSVSNEYFLKNYGTTMLPVFSGDIKEERFKKHRFCVKLKGKETYGKDLEIRGLGFFKFINTDIVPKELVFELYTSEYADVDWRDALWGFKEKSKQARKVDKRIIHKNR